MSNEWRWETKNNDAIMAAMGDEDRKHFSIDVRSLVWDDYYSLFMATAIGSVV